MSMARQELILLTDAFPFGGLEPFLETEVPYLAAKFRRLHIVAVTHESSPVRAVPENATITRLPLFPNRRRQCARFWRRAAALLHEGPSLLRRHGILPLRSLYREMRQTLSNAGQIRECVAGIMAKKHIEARDAVLYSYWAMASAVAVADLKRTHPESRAVCRAHGWDVYEERHPSRPIPFRAFLLRRLDALYCVSGHGAAYVDKKTSYRHTATIQVRYLGVRAPGRDNPAGDSVRRMLSLVSCSCIVANKRVQLIVDALDHFARNHREQAVDWTHIGEGEAGGERFAAGLKEYASKHLSQHASISYRFTGNLENRQVLSFYSQHPVDLFVAASRSEGLPVAMMEAASFGIPIVSSNVGGVPEIVRDLENGYLLPECPAPIDMATALARFAQLPVSDRLRMRARSKEAWRCRFNAATNYADFAEELAR